MIAATRWGLDLTILSMIPFSGCSHAETPQENSVATDKKMTLEKIAQQKRHHGKDRFINPFAPSGKKGFRIF